MHASQQQYDQDKEERWTSSSSNNVSQPEISVIDKFLEPFYVTLISYATVRHTFQITKHLVYPYTLANVAVHTPAPEFSDPSDEVLATAMPWRPLPLKPWRLPSRQQERMQRSLPALARRASWLQVSDHWRKSFQAALFDEL